MSIETNPTLAILSFASRQYGIIFAMQKNYYQILQVDPAAEPEVITAAYKRLSIKYHPDTNRSAEAHQRMQEINEAYQVLKDPARRTHYDLYLRGGHPDSQSGGGNGSHRADAAPPSPGQGYSPSRQSGPQSALANLIVTLSFPVTYLLTVFVLFRIFRSPNFIVIAAVAIVAVYIAYRVSKSVERYFNLRR